MQETINYIDVAEKNLGRQLKWISVHDTRAAFITGIDIAMAGYLIKHINDISFWNVFSISSVVLALGLLMVSFFYIYKGQYPNVTSPNDSVLFFGTIAKTYLDVFQRKITTLTEEEYLNDLASQIHANSQILSKKFSFLQISMLSTLLSVAPWLVTLFLI